MAARLPSHPQVYEEGPVAVEVSRFETASGPRLHVRDLSEGGEIFLDPFELEGLTRIRGGALRLGDHTDDYGNGEIQAENVGGEVFKNEFAMVTVGRLEQEGRVRLFIRDLASQAEAHLRPDELQGLTRLSHRQFAALLDPTELVSEAEPDPDQV